MKSFASAILLFTRFKVCFNLFIGLKGRCLLLKNLKPYTKWTYRLQPQLITDTVFDRMEAGTLSLIASLLTEYLDYLLSLNLQPSYRLSKDQKAECISACVVDRYSILHKLFLTSDYLQKKKQNSANGLEQQEENVFVTHFGSMLIVDNLDLFFDDNATPKEIEEKTLNYSPICCSLKESADQMHTLKVRELEAAILGIILLWNQIDRVMTKMRASKEAQTIHLQPLISFLKQQKKLFYSEFHNNLCENYGTHNAGLRLIELMNILAGLSELENSYKERT
uniref:Nuclear receptor domain-containing protein n=1 Tax=Ditylenchus dipsaci TaxID=166011 RepID=A0A915CY63_9BILA